MAATPESRLVTAEIIDRLGFLPASFAPATGSPVALQALWRQNLVNYLDNPLPALFKEQVLTRLARHCEVSYVLVRHACQLRPLGMKAETILQLLEDPASGTDAFSEGVLPLVEDAFIGVHAAAPILINRIGLERYVCCAQLIAFAKADHLWLESHPEISADADARLRAQLDALLAEEPRFAELLRTHRERARSVRAAASKARLHAANDRTGLLDFASVVNASGEALISVNLDGRIESWNPAAERLFGWPARDASGSPISIIVPPDRLHELEEIRTRVRRGETIENFETMRQRRDGTRLHTELTIAPRVTPEGSIVGTAAILRDITKRRQAEEALRASEARHRALVETANDAIVASDQRGRITAFNRSAERTFGCSAASVLGRPLTLLMPERLQAEYLAGFARLLETGVSALLGRTVELVGVRRDGAEFPVEISLASWKEDGSVAFAAILRDVTEARRVRHELEREAAFVKLLQEVAVAANQAGNVREALQVAVDRICALTQWPIGHALLMCHGEVPSLGSAGVWHFDDPERFAAFKEASAIPTFAVGIGVPGRVLASSKAAWVSDVRDDVAFRRPVAEAAGLRSIVAFPLLAAAEVVGALEFFASAAVEPDPELLTVMAHIGTQLGRGVERERAADAAREAARLLEERVDERTRDLGAANKQLQGLNEQLETVARVDLLTGLLNRRGLQQVLDQETERSGRDGSTLVAMLLDLDDFKRVNTRLGHAVGDVLLKEVAMRLRSKLRATDQAARVGGDEFIVLVPQTRPAEAVRVAEKLRLAVGERPIALAAGPIKVTASAALVSTGSGPISIDELLSQMHPLLQRSKTTGKNRVSHRWPGIAEGGHRDDLPELVKRLLDPDSYRVVVQPIRRIADEEVTGYELFSRSRIEGLEMPDDFFRASLEADNLTVVDHFCFRGCIKAASRLPRHLRCHVNLFPSTLLAVPPQHLLAEIPVAAKEREFCVEISEQQIIGDPEYLVEAVRALQHGGVRIAIDDVGFGRTCLESLILLEPDVIKVDRRLVGGIGRSQSRARALERLLRMAEHLKAEIVAEGIEQREDLERLKSLGVALGQGYLWGRPRPVEA